MNKQEIIEVLVSNYMQDEDEVKAMSKKDLKSLLDDLEDESDMFPNGRDYDAEDEDGF